MRLDTSTEYEVLVPETATERDDLLRKLRGATVFEGNLTDLPPGNKSWLALKPDKVLGMGNDFFVLRPIGCEFGYRIQTVDANDPKLIDFSRSDDDIRNASIPRQDGQERTSALKAVV